MPIPKEISGQKYVCLTTFRKSGIGVVTPVWFAERDNKLYVKTRIESGKSKRIRNNPSVRVAPCTIRGKITARNLPAEPGFFRRSSSAPQKKLLIANIYSRDYRFGIARMNIWKLRSPGELELRVSRTFVIKITGCTLYNR